MTGPDTCTCTATDKYRQLDDACPFHGTIADLHRRRHALTNSAAGYRELADACDTIVVELDEQIKSAIGRADQPVDQPDAATSTTARYKR